MREKIKRSVPIERTPRVLQLEGMFDVPPAKRSEQAWDVDLPIDDHPWQIGLIVGPSGSGKTTIANQLFGAHLVGSFEWPKNRSIVDGFPKDLGITEITGYLSSVGFSSPPSWLRPFHCLSNGEQFRVTLARALAEQNPLTVIDEFTSVVDRTVAQIGSAAIAKTIRRGSKKFVAISCHYDIVDWLDPDWTYEPATGKFTWRLERRRPEIKLQIVRCHPSDWIVFKRHHYLSGNLNKAARCFIALVRGQPAAFTSLIYAPHANGGWWREHRSVCLPDFQGVGIGNALSSFVMSLFVPLGKPVRSTTSHPAMIQHRQRSPVWRMIRGPSMIAPQGCTSTRKKLTKTAAWDRITAGFLFVGPARPTESRAFGILQTDHLAPSTTPARRDRRSVRNNRQRFLAPRPTDRTPTDQTHENQSPAVGHNPPASLPPG